ncbi:MAG: hypothetical protein Q8918_05835 [Bacteroidota bacterium]|nr:hypothetical protein [Bacteroidota bacterium]MDP4212051.1 hypothetical protein [Bacteroidota bacterium]MDP4249618.1 hypothetical protein [Bacteroidota bacterium]
MHIIFRLFLVCGLLIRGSFVQAHAFVAENMVQDTIPKKEPKSSIRTTHNGISKYLNIITDREQRDSLLSQLSKQNERPPVADSVIWKNRQNTFSAYGGKHIRYIYFNQLKVFGTQIEDTMVASNKLIRFANRLHYNTRTWALRQALFFKEGDTINAYKMVDNERYLRSLPFIQDARMYVINSYQKGDSVDLVVVTKDLYEYGGSLANISASRASATIFNTNLLGAAQRLYVGFKWDEPYSPQSRTGIGYTKYNLGGTFTDVALGYSVLNDRPTTDTGVYERSTYFTLNRPLYSSWAKLTGGLTLSKNTSINIFNLPDSLYRNYQYSIVDMWAGYNFRNQFKGTGYNSQKPNIAVELRRYTMDFTVRPSQDTLRLNPNYNNHQYLLGKFVLFHQEFFKTNYFFGFGRTEDIPLGYNASASFGQDEWVGRIRTYTALEGQKYWLAGKNLISTNVGFGSFWYNHRSEDAVLHIQGDYYSNLFWLKDPKLREFLHADYLICFNPVLYKPVNINREQGLLGYRYTLFNNYQRLNLSAQTNYYSPLNVYGFKFNFYVQIQASLLAKETESILRSPFYSGYTIGCQIRNENLSFNTLQISASYQPLVDHGPQASNGPRSLFVQITSTTTFNFNIFALQAPAPIAFR